MVLRTARLLLPLCLLLLLLSALAAAAADTYRISGVVTGPGDEPLSGVSVALYQDDTPVAAAVTNAEGRYDFADLAAGTYCVRPNLSGTVFVPARRTVCVPPSKTSVNFTGTSGSTISGVVRDAFGEEVPGVTVALLQGDMTRATALTDLEGRYLFCGLAPGTYTVRPARTGLTFTPAERTVQVPPDEFAADFVANPVPTTSSIRGLIRDTDGYPIAEVSVALYEGSICRRLTLTDSRGAYLFVGLPAGQYTVQPTKAGFTFAPVSTVVTVPPSASNVNFTGTPAVPFSSVSGLITDAAGLPLAGVCVALKSADTTVATVTTGTDGRYSFLHLAPGTYTVRPSMVGKVFDPASRTLTVPPDVTAADFRALASQPPFTVCGRITNSHGGAVAGVTVLLLQRGVTVGVAVTNAEGRFGFSGLTRGTYVVKPQFARGPCDPLQMIVTVGPSCLNADFRLQVGATLSTVSGTVTALWGRPLAHVSVELRQGGEVVKTTTTDAEGFYRFIDVPGGSYVVKPSLGNLVFEPQTRAIMVPPDQTDLDFVAAAAPRLSGGSVTPAVGTTCTVFVFSVTYTNPRDTVPDKAVVVIDGTRVVKLFPQDADDTDCGDGRVYLGRAMLAPGLHQYRFVFEVGEATLRFPGPTNADYLIGPRVVGEECYSISGVVRAGESRLEDVRIIVTAQDGTQTVVYTKADGRYLAAGLAAGQYVVTAAKQGYVFEPATCAVSLPPSTCTCNFSDDTP